MYEDPNDHPIWQTPPRAPQYGPQPGTEQHAGYGVAGQPYAPPPPAARRRSWPRRHPILTGAAVLVGLAVVGTVSMSTQPPPLNTTAVPVGGAAPPAATTAPTTAAVVPLVPADFVAQVKVLSLECFDTYGCNVTYRVSVKQTAAAPTFAEGVTYEVTYDVTGSMDGATTDTVRITDGSYDLPIDGIARVPNRKAVLHAKVTAVDELGG